MVIFFECSETDKYIVFMGRDKTENEELLRWRLPCDVWFHVDNVSSAHVYLRLRAGGVVKMAELGEDILDEMGQLVKENSIKGRKMGECYVNATPTSNLKKTANMVAGQVGYHDKSKVLRYKVVKNRSTINRLKKTKEEKRVDLKRVYDDYYAEEKRRKKAELAKKRRREAQERKERVKLEKIKNYDGFFTDRTRMKSNKETSESKKKTKANDDSDSDSDSHGSSDFSDDDFM